MRLRYWVRLGWKNLGISLLAAAWGIFVSASWAEPDTAAWLLLEAAAIVLMALSISAFTLHLPLAISFGSTRREAAVGMHILRLLPIACMAALIAVLAPHAGLPAGSVGIGIGSLLLFAALGAICGMLSVRFGAWAVALLTGLVIGCAVASMILLPTLPELLPQLPYLALGLGAAVYMAASFAEHRMVRRKNVTL